MAYINVGVLIFGLLAAPDSSLGRISSTAVLKSFPFSSFYNRVENFRLKIAEHLPFLIWKYSLFSPFSEPLAQPSKYLLVELF